MAEPTTPTDQEPPKNEGLDVVPKAELEKLLEKTAQSAADRVRTEYSQKLKAAQEEAENLRMEKMTAKERAEVVTAKQKEELERLSKDLNRREQELLATKELEKNGLDIEFLNFVIGSDKDATLGNIATLKEKFDKAMGKAVDTKLKASGRDPTKGRLTGETSSFEGMTAKEIQRKSREDPEWFDNNRDAINKATSQGLIKRS